MNKILSETYEMPLKNENLLFKWNRKTIKDIFLANQENEVEYW